LDKIVNNTIKIIEKILKSNQIETKTKVKIDVD